MHIFFSLWYQYGVRIVTIVLTVVVFRSGRTDRQTRGKKWFLKQLTYIKGLLKKKDKRNRQLERRILFDAEVILFLKKFVLLDADFVLMLSVLL